MFDKKKLQRQIVSLHEMALNAGPEVREIMSGVASAADEMLNHLVADDPRAINDVEKSSPLAMMNALIDRLGQGDGRFVLRQRVEVCGTCGFVAFPENDGVPRKVIHRGIAGICAPGCHNANAYTDEAPAVQLLIMLMGTQGMFSSEEAIEEYVSSVGHPLLREKIRAMAREAAGLRAAAVKYADATAGKDDMSIKDADRALDRILKNTD